MFTGIIEALGSVRALRPTGADTRIAIDTGTLDLGDVAVGDSIATSGVCLTAVEVDAVGFWADVSGETLSKTTLGDLRVGDPVNLEKALTPDSRMGGHLVSGHVDGVGEVCRRWEDGRSVRFVIRSPNELSHYIAAKGSICVDGISLTVNRVENNEFELNIVPHTLEETTMADFQAGRRVNLEVDVIARYLERLLFGTPGAAGGPGITREFLTEHGFMRPD